MTGDFKITFDWKNAQEQQITANDCGYSSKNTGLNMYCSATLVMGEGKGNYVKIDDGLNKAEAEYIVMQLGTALDDGEVSDAEADAFLKKIGWDSQKKSIGDKTYDADKYDQWYATAKQQIKAIGKAIANKYGTKTSTRTEKGTYTPIRDTKKVTENGQETTKKLAGLGEAKVVQASQTGTGKGQIPPELAGTEYYEVTVTGWNNGKLPEVGDGEVQVDRKNNALWNIIANYYPELVGKWDTGECHELLEEIRKLNPEIFASGRGKVGGANAEWWNTYIYGEGETNTPDKIRIPTGYKLTSEDPEPKTVSINDIDKAKVGDTYENYKGHKITAVDKDGDKVVLTFDDNTTQTFIKKDGTWSLQSASGGEKTDVSALTEGDTFNGHKVKKVTKNSDDTYTVEYSDGTATEKYKKVGDNWELVTEIEEGGSPGAGSGTELKVDEATRTEITNKAPSLMKSDFSSDVMSDDQLYTLLNGTSGTQVNIEVEEGGRTVVYAYVRMGDEIQKFETEAGGKLGKRVSQFNRKTGENCTYDYGYLAGTVDGCKVAVTHMKPGSNDITLVEYLDSDDSDAKVLKRIDYSNPGGGTTTHPTEQDRYYAAICGNSTPSSYVVQMMEDKNLSTEDKIAIIERCSKANVNIYTILEKYNNSGLINKYKESAKTLLSDAAKDTTISEQRLLSLANNLGNSNKTIWTILYGADKTAFNNFYTGLTRNMKLTKTTYSDSEVTQISETKGRLGHIQKKKIGHGSNSYEQVQNSVLENFMAEMDKHTDPNIIMKALCDHYGTGSDVQAAFSKMVEDFNKGPRSNANTLAKFQGYMEQFLKDTKTIK